MAEVEEMKRNWWGGGYEFFYPNEFSPVFPWIKEGTNQHAKHPRFPWKEDEFPQHFPNKHEYAQTFILDNARTLGCDGTPGRLSIPITHLSHCTHEEEKEDITTEPGQCIFKPKAKVGRPAGTSYTYAINDELPERRPGIALPGYLSWWGISVKNWYDNDVIGKEKKAAIKNLKGGGDDIKYVFVPNYIQGKPSGPRVSGHPNTTSAYGDWSFTYDINTLVENYKVSRDDCKDEDEKKVHFKKAGTLRYRHEICYVILVCTSKDLTNPSIKCMPAATECPTAEKVDEPNLDPPTYFEIDGHGYFNSEYPIRAIYPEGCLGCFYSWDQLVFAFHFPHEQQKLICDHTMPKPAHHEPGFCHLKPNCPYV